MKIGAVIVLFNPNYNLLIRVLDFISPQVDEVLLVDNSKIDCTCLLNKHKNIIYYNTGKNIGIAAAQNYGILYFKKKNYNFVLFSDQDSTGCSDLVARLIKAWNFLLKNNILVASVGTSAVNRIDKRKYFNKYNFIKSIKLDDTDSLSEVYSVMSSISIVDVNNFSRVGLLEEDLFIDGVDNEWGWRARSLGFKSFVVDNAIIHHQLGIGDKAIFGHKISIPPPSRCYFQFRNFFILIRRSYTPKWWILLNSFKYFIKIIYFPVFLEPRVLYMKHIFKGIFDGLKICFSSRNSLS